MDEKAAALRREYNRLYARKWREKNKEKSKEYKARYWQNRALEMRSTNDRYSLEVLEAELLKLKQRA